MIFLIPFRDRQSHLDVLQPVLEMIGTVIVIEQCDNKPFNRGRLINIGFDLIVPIGEKIVIHDVDMVPQRCNYQFEGIAHFASQVQQFHFRKPYYGYFGGVTGFDYKDFKAINGFSNDYWGWGAEDDDLLARVKLKKLKPKFLYGRFNSLKHEHQLKPELHKVNVATLKKGVNFESGLSNCLENCSYEIQGNRIKVFFK
jgi:hypothetical protein